MDPNPFAALSLIVAPAILTNACAVLSMSTSNRLARAVDRARELAKQLEDPVAGAGGPESTRRLGELAAAEQRTVMLLGALRSFYVALGAFAAATLVREGMLARLDRFCEYFGVPPFPHPRARHERSCRRAGGEGGLAVPDGGAVVQRALESLALEDEDVAPEVDWREAARRVAQIDREASG